MAKRTLAGQLNMFDFYRNLEGTMSGEVEMVSLMPQDEPEAEPMPKEEPKAKPKPKPKTKPKTKSKQESKIAKKSSDVLVSEKTMDKTIEETIDDTYETIIDESKRERLALKQDLPQDVAMCRQYVFDGNPIEIAYINYNKVRIIKGNQPIELYEFDSTKEAVDYYVQKIQELEPEE